MSQYPSPYSQGTDPQNSNPQHSSPWGPIPQDPQQGSVGAGTPWTAPQTGVPHQGWTGQQAGTPWTGQPQPYPAQQYPGQPYQGQAYPGQPYQGQPYPGQPLPQQAPWQQGHPTDGQLQPADHQKRAPLLGMIAFGVVLLTGIAMLLASWHSGVVFGRLLQANGGQANDVQDLQQRLPQYYQPFLRSVQVMSAISSLGFAGWVACIVATVRRSARALAVTGIVLGVLVVLASLGMFVAAFMPYVPQQ